MDERRACRRRRGNDVWAVENETVNGPVNAVMPAPFRNSDFTRELAQCGSGVPPSPLLPAFALRLALGELSHAMLDSARVAPGIARKHGYAYQFPTLPLALGDAAR